MNVAYRRLRLIVSFVLLLLVIFVMYSVLGGKRGFADDTEVVSLSGGTDPGGDSGTTLTDGKDLTNIWNGITAGTYSNVVINVGPDITVTSIVTGAAGGGGGGGIAAPFPEFFSGTTNGGVDTSFSATWYNMPIDTTAVSHVDTGGFWDSATGYWSGFTSDWVHINFTLMGFNWSATEFIQVVVRKNKSTSNGGIYRRFHFPGTVSGETRSFPYVACFIDNVNGATNVYELQFKFTGGTTDPDWNTAYNRVTIYGFDLP